MSRFDNSSLQENQYHGLQPTVKPKKIPPAVPPKKKAQPQVPRSTVVSNICEPQYSSKITPLGRAPTYENQKKDYANVAVSRAPTDLFTKPLDPTHSKYVEPESPPPTPPPPPLDYDQETFDLNQNLEYLPPPSPVSSNYSELVRATANLNFINDRPYPVYQNEFPEYGVSQATYESIYEPIDPHPNKEYRQLQNQNKFDYVQRDFSTTSHPSSEYRQSPVQNQNKPINIQKDLSAAPHTSSEYRQSPVQNQNKPINIQKDLSAAPHTSSDYRQSLVQNKPTEHGNFEHKQQPTSVPMKSQQKNSSNKSLSKEQEVDALTDMLVKSISDSQDLDYFGICAKCNGKIAGENTGCTAMGNMYHINCFCCFICKTNLHGKKLYAVEGEPYCEADYYETLEKCTVCKKPILDRILRATGNPYHSECFTCVVCGKSLDGIPFTVDALNQIHCIEDFHKKFAPRCCVCELPIMPEEGQEETVRVVALDRSFHVQCYKCEDCGMQLSSEADGRGCYPLDNHILCKYCNAHRIRLLTNPNVMTTDL